MRATISKEFTFAASHQLEGLPDDHPCSRLHGHNYVVRVELTGTLDGVGFVVDYREMGWFKELLDDCFDHRHLNDTMEVNPTAEHLATLLLQEVLWWIRGREGYRERVELVQVGISETPKTWATVGALVEPQS